MTNKLRGILAHADPLIVAAAAIVLMWGELWQGYVAAKKQHFFGLRLHFTTNVLGPVGRWLLAPASLDERDVMPYLVTDDSGYVSTDLADVLFLDCCHRLLALRRCNQKQ